MVPWKMNLIKNWWLQKHRRRIHLDCGKGKEKLCQTPGGKIVTRESNQGRDGCALDDSTGPAAGLASLSWPF